MQFEYARKKANDKLIKRLAPVDKVPKTGAVQTSTVREMSARES